jgi:hypothetical protein
MIALTSARTLVAHVPLGRWRASLGEPVAPEPGDPSVRRDDNLAARRLARAVERAAARLPGEAKCLPRAMALQWLLRRRGFDAKLVIGVRPGAARGGLDDLHAWIVRRGEILVGASDEEHRAIYAAATGRAPLGRS